MLRLLFALMLYFAGVIDLTSGEKENHYYNNNKYVSVRLEGQFGNQLFQIATAYAYALDHSLPLTVPDLVHKTSNNVPFNAKTLFLSRIPSYDLPRPPLMQWREPNFNYNKIPNSTAIELMGFFQSEKYFKHRRNALLKLFAAPEGMNDQILSKYPFLNDPDVFTVGIQIRDYRHERPNGDYHPTLSRSYYEKAMAQFPDDAIFLVTTNNPAYARACTEGIKPNTIYLNGSSYIEEFYTLVFCKSFIIANSSFGWWASWLSTANNKTVIAPKPWFAPPFDFKAMEKDLLPPEYIVIEADAERR